MKNKENEDQITSKKSAKTKYSPISAHCTLSIRRSVYAWESHFIEASTYAQPTFIKSKWAGIWS